MAKISGEDSRCFLERKNGGECLTSESRAAVSHNNSRVENK